jgi:predicted GIY-YIG superfamily endonuclease
LIGEKRGIMSTELVNLSKINLDSLSQRKAVYAIFAQDKESDTPIDCRYVGVTDNIRERIRAHFSKKEQNDCLRKFMQSGETKLMRYELMSGSKKDDRLIKEEEWIEKYNPECNE